VPLHLRPHASIHIAGSDTATASFRPRLPPELEFATDRSGARYIWLLGLHTGSAWFLGRNLIV
jgi:hypothetical protein